MSASNGLYDILRTVLTVLTEVLFFWQLVRHLKSIRRFNHMSIAD